MPKIGSYARQPYVFENKFYVASDVPLGSVIEVGNQEVCGTDKGWLKSVQIQEIVDLDTCQNLRLFPFDGQGSHRQILRKQRIISINLISLPELKESLNNSRRRNP